MEGGPRRVRVRADEKWVMRGVCRLQQEEDGGAVKEGVLGRRREVNSLP
jgi:hypothetical protein